MANEESLMPLESNPDVINDYLKQLNLHRCLQCTDVFAFDDFALEFLPQPVVALLLLFPITDEYENFMKVQIKDKQHSGNDALKRVYFIKQTMTNACGTIALLHALANNERLIPKDSGFISEFLNRTRHLTPQERADCLLKEKGLLKVHEAAANEGQTEPIAADQKVDLHFICLVNVDNHLYELDGRKPFPIDHGATTVHTFLRSALKVCQEFIDRESENLNFTVLALSAVSQEG